MSAGKWNTFLLAEFVTVSSARCQAGPSPPPSCRSTARSISPRSTPSKWNSSTFREHSGNIQGTFREHSGNIQGTFREHSGNIQGTFREHNQLILIIR
eukprot:1182296-Prorocentrum_minimum.AAC.7